MSFNFSEKKRDELLALPISATAKEMINATEPKGKTAKYLPVIFDISEESQLKDVFVVAEFRKENI